MHALAIGNSLLRQRARKSNEERQSTVARHRLSNGNNRRLQKMAAAPKARLNKGEDADPRIVSTQSGRHAF